MLATFTIVGYLCPQTENTSEEFSSITVETERAFRRADGVLENDRLSVRLWKGIVQECLSAQPGTLLVIRGRIESDQEGKTVLIGEKVSFGRDRY
jgi:hypothetical protein